VVDDFEQKRLEQVDPGLFASLQSGDILFIGTVEDLKKHPSERIQNLLNRRSEEAEIDADEYLRRLTGKKLESEGTTR